MKIVYAKSEVGQAKAVRERISTLIGEELPESVFPMALTEEQKAAIKCATITETEDEVIIEYKPEFTSDIFGLANQAVDLIAPIIPLYKNFVAILVSMFEGFEEIVEEFKEKWL